MLAVTLAVALGIVPVPSTGACDSPARASSTQDPKPIERVLPPASSIERDLRAEVDIAFGCQAILARKDKAAIASLSEQLLGAARKGEDPPATMYVLLMRALETAEQVARRDLIEASLAQLDQRFHVNLASLRFESAQRLSKITAGVNAPDVLVAMYCTAGSEFLPTSMELARRSLGYAKEHARRCTGNVGKVAGEQVSALERAIADVKAAADRLPVSEVVRVPVPPSDDASRIAARAMLRELHRDLDSMSKVAAAALAAANLDEGMATRRNLPGARHEWLLHAIKAAARGGDLTVVLSALQELDLQFFVDVDTERLAAAKLVVLRNVTPAEDVFRFVMEVARSRGADPALVREAVLIAEQQRERHRGNRVLHEQLGRELELARVERELRTREADLREAHAAEPDDPAHAEELGWFLCTSSGNWEEGLPLLAIGRTRVLGGQRSAGEIAQLELRPAPTDEDKWTIASAWMAHADSPSCSGEERAFVVAHYRTWLERLRHLDGVRGMAVRKKLAETEGAKVGSAAKAAIASASAPKGPAGMTGKPAEAVARALDWLAAHQDEDGRWDSDGFMKHDSNGEPCDGPGSEVYDVGLTGLAALAFLEAGCDPRAGSHDRVVQKALAWLQTQQDPVTGLFGTPISHDFVYGHAIATQAMAAAAKLTKDPGWMKATEKGLAQLLSHRNPHGVWRYQPRDNDNDQSVTTWCFAACKLAEQAGCAVGNNVWKSVATWLDQVSDPTGLHGYCRAGEPSARKPGDHGTRFPVERTESMTACGLYCRHLLKQRSPVMDAAAERLLLKLPSADEKARCYYYWYHGSKALGLTGGGRLAKWRAALFAVGIPLQRRDGNAIGSWDPNDVWGEDHGRVGATALMCLSLVAASRQGVGK